MENCWIKYPIFVSHTKNNHENVIFHSQLGKLNFHSDFSIFQVCYFVQKQTTWFPDVYFVGKIGNPNPVSFQTWLQFVKNYTDSSFTWDFHTENIDGNVIFQPAFGKCHFYTEFLFQICILLIKKKIPNFYICILVVKQKSCPFGFHNWLLYGKLLDTLLYFIATLNQNKQEKCFFSILTWKIELHN